MNLVIAPEKFEISQNMLSNYCFNIANDYGVKIGGVNKLVSNLANKSKYVVHYRNLQLYLLLEYCYYHLLLTHRILKFKQYDWLKKYMILIQTKEKMELIVLKNIF